MLVEFGSVRLLTLLTGISSRVLSNRREDKCFIMETVRITAPNGAIYKFDNLSKNVVGRLQNDRNYVDCMLCLAFRSKMEPISGLTYYDPAWETKFKSLPARGTVAPIHQDGESSKKLETTDISSSPPRKKVDQKATPKKEDFGSSSDKIIRSSSQIERDSSKKLETTELSFSTPRKRMAPKGPSKKLNFDVSVFDVASTSSTFTAKVEVSGLPENFSDVILMYELNKALCDLNFCDEATELAEAVLERKDGTAIVQFASVEAAKEVCTCSISYKKHPLSLMQLSTTQDCHVVNSQVSTLTNRVNVSGLPENFSEVILMYELNKALCDLNFCDEATELAEAVLEKEDGTAIVQFASVEAAKEVCTCSISYKKHPLSLMQLSTTQDCPVVNSQVSTLTNRVNVSGLPENFSEAVLIYELSQALCDSGLCGDEDEPPLCIIERRETSAVVEFASVTAAAEACLVCLVKYKKNILTLHHLTKEPENFERSPGLSRAVQNIKISENLVDEDYLRHRATKEGSTVLFSNVSASYTEETFIETLSKELKELYPELTMKLIENCLYKPNSNSVEVEFCSCEVATLATELIDLHYKSCKLLMQKIHVGGRNETFQLDASFSDNDLQNMGKESREFSLGDDEGRDAFIKLLIKYKNDFPKSGAHEPLFEVIRPKLIKKGVIATVAEMRIKRNRLREKYRKLLRDERKGNVLFMPLHVAFGNQDIAVLKGTRWELSDHEDEDETEVDALTEDLINFSKAATWTINSTKCLLNICIDLKSDYDNHRHHDKFWRKISHLLAEKKYFYPGEKCQSKVDALKREYKNYMEEAHRTGAEGPSLLIPNPETRMLMDLMGQLLVSNVTVKPKYILGAGVSSVEENTSMRHETVGRTRVPTLQKAARKEAMEERAERKLAADEMKAAALRDIANSLLKK